MSSLKPKEKAGSNSMSLTSVAKMLKDPSSIAREKNAEVVKQPETSKVQEESKAVHKECRRVSDIVKNTKFEDILEEIENKDYICTGVIYIDEEIKEVLSLLKSKGKIRTSSLVSYILEQFLDENKDDISAIIKSSNRFL